MCVEMNLTNDGDKTFFGSPKVGAGGMFLDVTATLIIRQLYSVHVKETE